MTPAGDFKAAPGAGPVISEIEPTSVLYGTPELRLTILGTGFNADSVVVFAGTTYDPTVVSPAQTLAAATSVGAKAMGYDSCPMDGFDFEAVADLIQLPEDHVIAMFVAIGKGTKEAWDRPGQLSLDEVVINNTFD